MVSFSTSLRPRNANQGDRTMKTATALTPEMTKAQALGLLQAGEVTPEQYLEWDKQQGKAARANASKECPVSLVEFLGDAAPMAVSLGTMPITARPLKFSTGSFG